MMARVMTYCAPYKSPFDAAFCVGGNARYERKKRGRHNDKYFLHFASLRLFSKVTKYTLFCSVRHSNTRTVPSRSESM